MFPIIALAAKWVDAAELESVAEATARRQVEHLGDAIKKPAHRTLSEDYTVIELRRVSDEAGLALSSSRLLSRYGMEIAQVVRGVRPRCPSSRPVLAARGRRRRLQRRRLHVAVAGLLAELPVLGGRRVAEVLDMEPPGVADQGQHARAGRQDQPQRAPEGIVGELPAGEAQAGPSRERPDTTAEVADPAERQLAEHLQQHRNCLRAPALLAGAHLGLRRPPRDVGDVPDEFHTQTPSVEPQDDGTFIVAPTLRWMACFVVTPAGRSRIRRTRDFWWRTWSVIQRP